MGFIILNLGGGIQRITKAPSLENEVSLMFKSMRDGQNARSLQEHEDPTHKNCCSEEESRFVPVNNHYELPVRQTWLVAAEDVFVSSFTQQHHIQRNNYSLFRG
jgi:hypothetical protein